MKQPSPALRPRAAYRSAAAVALFVAAIATLASCSLSRPTPVKSMFLLEPTMPAAVAAAPKAVAVRVGIVNVAAPFRGKTFVYRDSELKYDADFYDEFFVAPAIMLSDATAKALRAANVFRRVVPAGATGDDAEYVLDGFASELYGDVRSPTAPVAALTITFYLSPTNVVNPGVIWSREYRQRVQFSGAGADALARGWNAALSALLADLARDLAATELPK
jgi:cholesterol transport system auxiliary component